MIRKKHLVVIAGPTASGKTAVAIEIAKYYRTEIVSADSRQFFREMSIGTAVPSLHQLAEVKHHFIHSHSITQEMNAGIYEGEALLLLEQLFSSHDVVVLAGGTGLYINAVLSGIDDLPKGDVLWRQEQQLALQEKGLEYFAQMLKAVDPVAYQNTDTKNPRRVLRALEVFELTGKTYSSLIKKTDTSRNFTSHIICLDKPREILYSDINFRVDEMINNGLEGEARSLLPFRGHNALSTVGYKEFFGYFDGKKDLPSTVQSVKQNTRNYAKRQLTWFRGMHGANWIIPEAALKSVQLIVDANH